LADKLPFKFSHRFNGSIWNIVAVSEQQVLVLEIRDQTAKSVSFDALDVAAGKFLWRDLRLDEPWWVNLSAATRDTMLFTIYLEQQNPDKKGILDYNLRKPALRWWNNDFSLTHINGEVISGFSTKLGQRTVQLDLETGMVRPFENIAAEERRQVGPVQYLEGSNHFETVRTFLERKLNFKAVAALEYLEYNNQILISYYVTEKGLANYLIVLDQSGSVRLHEKLDEHLKGIGLDTFFVLSGCLIFVKNREELVSYFL
jgi:hypothetical protein